VVGVAAWTLPFFALTFLLSCAWQGLLGGWQRGRDWDRV